MKKLRAIVIITGIIYYSTSCKVNKVRSKSVNEVFEGLKIFEGKWVGKTMYYEIIEEWIHQDNDTYKCISIIDMGRVGSYKDTLFIRNRDNEIILKTKVDMGAGNFQPQDLLLVSVNNNNYYFHARIKKDGFPKEITYTFMPDGKLEIIYKGVSEGTKERDIYKLEKQNVP